MPLFMAVLKWKSEDDIEIAKGYAAFLNDLIEEKLPKGVELCAGYGAAQQRWLVWKAPSKADLEKYFDQFAPTLKKYTEFVPVTQSYPPTMEYVFALMQAFIKAASK
jgi:hypothetical protein